MTDGVQWIISRIIYTTAEQEALNEFMDRTSDMLDATRMYHSRHRVTHLDLRADAMNAAYFAKPSLQQSQLFPLLDAHINLEDEGGGIHSVRRGVVHLTYKNKEKAAIAFEL